MVQETSESRIHNVNQQTGDSEEPMEQKVWRQLLEKFLLPGGASLSVQFRPLPDWMRPTHIVEGNLLKPKFSDLGVEVKVKVAQSCPTFYDPLYYTVPGILQARMWEWVAFPFSRGSAQPRDWTQVSHIAGRFFTNWATWEAQFRC